MTVSTVDITHMQCPNGCEERPERYRSPLNVPGVGLVRRHRCPNCRKVFMSLQKVIVGRHAEAILMRLETHGSVLTPEMTPSGTSATQES